MDLRQHTISNVHITVLWNSGARNSEKDGKRFNITEMQKADSLARLFHTELRES